MCKFTLANEVTNSSTWILRNSSDSAVEVISAQSFHIKKPSCLPRTLLELSKKVWLKLISKEHLHRHRKHGKYEPKQKFFEYYTHSVFKSHICNYNIILLKRFVCSL